MANLRAIYLAPEEIGRIVTPLLRRDFESYGLTDTLIKEDETFDGDPVIRVRAEVRSAVPAGKLVETLTRIHDALRAHNDERIVFLSAPGPDMSPQDDADEDMD